MISQNLKGVLSDLAKYNPKPQLIAVSKTKPLDMLQEAYDAGQRLFGENYIAELEEKVPQMPKDVQWHVIGHIQSNKVNIITKLVNEEYNIVVQTIDSIKLADKFEKQLNRSMSIMIQVLVSDEISKTGCKPEDVEALVAHIKTNCKNLKYIGLMCIADPNNTEKSFLQLQELQNKFGGATSMGMSDDYPVAIKYGTSYVRIGTKIFGAREYHKQ